MGVRWSGGIVWEADEAGLLGWWVGGFGWVGGLEVWGGEWREWRAS